MHARLKVSFIAAAMLAGAAMASPAGAYSVKGMGKCTGWVGGTDDRFWILGFISGSNYAKNANAARNIEADDIFRFVTRYCTENPNDDLADATTAFLKTH